MSQQAAPVAVPPRPARDRGAAGDWVENRPRSSWLPRLDWRELWEYRELAFFLALRDVKLRYRQTFFGIAWAALQPLAAAAVFTVVFQRVVDLPSDGIPYVVFVYAGLVAWTYASTGVEWSAQSLVEKADLVTKVYFPRLLAPLAAVLPGLLDLAVSLVILAAFMAIFGVGPGIQLILLPLCVVLLVALTAGVGFLLSALNVQYRDVKHTLSFLIQLWFFASPIAYPTSVLSEGWRYVFALNPMVGLIELFRWCVLDAPAPGRYALVSAASGLALIAAGLVYFQRTERRFADVV